MGLVISTQRAADNRPARLSRDAFFASGATVDHKSHVHEFAIADEQVIMRNLRRKDDGETEVTDEKTVSKEEAFVYYEMLLRADEINSADATKLLLTLALLEMMAETDAELSAQHNDNEEDAKEPTSPRL